MIDERGSLERRPSSWKSNKYPVPTGWTRRWYVQEAFSQDDHVLNRLPLLKYSWWEIYPLIFHYLPALLCILQELSTRAARSHGHLPPSRSAEDSFSAAHALHTFDPFTFSSLCRHFRQFFLSLSLSVSDTLWRREELLGCEAVEVFGWLHVRELTEAEQNRFIDADVCLPADSLLLVSLAAGMTNTTGGGQTIF